jgi:3-oxoacyl-[acyl-carrier-protein] synthase III
MERKLISNELVVLCSFGAGLTYGAAVIPTIGLPDKEQDK